MTTKLLDTTFLIHYWAGRDAVAEYLEAREDTCEFATTAINLKEIAVGRKLQGQFDPREIRSKFEWVRLVPFGVEHAFSAGELEASLREDDDINQQKVNALAGDLLIASVAAELGAPVVTRNVEDFELFDGVSVETY
ncbi:type II toxin-antitoxin system VapC family toxin [Halorussus amylolyticus]|uniref:type II toxin-antitoxin system VapC family toxin n=1 Tax=Halorussus amylolyticus TaxID=1126242 RepID=UPI0010469D51|nr:PIN domain-containing protein [Halorussus amylolyticus]